MEDRFYLDTEFTNGNYYRGDIFELALISEKTCRIFHQYIQIPYDIPTYVKRMCKVSDLKLKRKGVPFAYMLQRLIQFIKSETDTPTIIAHGGYLFDFPLLFANCLKHNIDITEEFKKYKFIDSIKVLKEFNICKRHGLQSISENHYHQHSAVEDAKALMNVFTKQYPYKEIIKQTQLVYLANGILQILEEKLPVSINELHSIVSATYCIEHLIQKLEQYVYRKSALNRKQLVKVSLYAYKYLR